MIVIPDLDQLELDDEAWGHLCTMASERQIFEKHGECHHFLLLFFRGS